MAEATRRELERRLEQSRRLSRGASDPTTFERLEQLIDDLEKQRADEKEGARTSLASRGAVNDVSGSFTR
jgi:hypothetical protein